MQTKIKQICKDLEKEYEIEILFCIEAGSRVWRMESENSDYDVRFVYKYKPYKYLQLNKPKEVIDRQYENKLIDVLGFDIYKFCKLLAQSNPTCIEWLESDIIYYGEQPKDLKSYATNHFNPISLYYHYASMCHSNYKKYIKS